MKDNRKKSVFVFGGGGHAKVVIDILEKMNIMVEFVADDDETLKGSMFFGYPVIGGRKEVLTCLARNPQTQAFVAIGENRARMTIAKWLDDRGIPSTNAVHPAAVVSRGVKLGVGIAMMANSVVNADTVLGNDVILNTSASVDHDCHIGAGTHIAPGVHLCGGVRIGENCLIGVGTVVRPNIKIGRDVIVSAGATVICDLPDGVSAMGTPARISKGNS